MNTPSGITELPNGQWVLSEDTHLSKWAREKGHIVTDPHVFRFLRPYLMDAQVVWDIGANIGDHTLQYLDWGMEVVAVEPNPLAFACLAHNCPDAHLINAAASDYEDEPLKLMLSENVGASRIHEDGDIDVRPVVMDNEPLPAPDFIKLDVEGFEVAALAGMRDTIERYRPVVFCEINEGALNANGVGPVEIYSFFKDLKYETDLRYPRSANLGDPQYDVLFLPHP